MIGAKAKRALGVERIDGSSATVSARGKGAGRSQGTVFMAHECIDLVTRCGVGHHKNRASIVIFRRAQVGQCNCAGGE
jgi:hypothetical protein